MRNLQILLGLLSILSFTSCSDDDNYEAIPSDAYPNVTATFGSNLNLSNLYNYANQTIPSYITKDNSAGNIIDNKIATLGRVLFYDKNLSSNNTISCARSEERRVGKECRSRWSP